MLAELSGASNPPSHRPSQDQKAFHLHFVGSHSKTWQIQQLELAAWRLQREGSHGSAGRKGLPRPIPLPNAQDILTASGVLCTAPCQRRSVSASSSSSLCVCGEEGKAQLWHNQMVAEPMPGTAHTGKISYPTTQPHSVFPAFWKSQITWI